MPSNWERQLQEIRALRRERDQRDEKLYSAKLHLQQAIERRDKARRGNVEGDVAKLKRAHEKAKSDLDETRDLLRAGIGKLVPKHPRDVLGSLRDDIPILLLPLRIETRFVTVDDGTELWIR